MRLHTRRSRQSLQLIPCEPSAELGRWYTPNDHRAVPIPEGDPEVDGAVAGGWHSGVVDEYEFRSNAHGCIDPPWFTTLGPPHDPTNAAGFLHSIHGGRSWVRTACHQLQHHPSEAQPQSSFALRLSGRIPASVESQLARAGIDRINSCDGSEPAVRAVVRAPPFCPEVKSVGKFSCGSE